MFLNFFHCLAVQILLWKLIVIKMEMEKQVYIPVIIVLLQGNCNAHI